MGDVTRFAPSPTGYLHLGHAASALFAVRQAGADGRFLLRIEDIDSTRCRAEFVDAIYQDLAWLGLDWQRPVRIQSTHFKAYRSVLDRLWEMGLLYRCFCTRKDIQIAGIGNAPHGVLYPGTCRHLSPAESQDRMAAGETYALRLDMGAAMARIGRRLYWHDRAAGRQTACPEVFGDVVLARKDTPTSYHVAVTLDDHIQEVSLVTRGEDLFSATHVHRLLQEVLGYHVPEYHHHPLLSGADGKRLSKRDKSKTLRSMHKEGMTADLVIAEAAAQTAPDTAEGK